MMISNKNDATPTFTCFAFLAALMTRTAETEAATAIDARLERKLRAVCRISSVVDAITEE